ncbi:hypothetical protein MMMB2_2246 [Mycobacterium marinum MB2]|nr:hypothetical protein MMMB2_2246 [Mycobacterium marinum MB2]
MFAESALAVTPTSLPSGTGGFITRGDERSSVCWGHTRFALSG